MFRHTFRMITSNGSLRLYERTRCDSAALWTLRCIQSAICGYSPGELFTIAVNRRKQSAASPYTSPYTLVHINLSIFTCPYSLVHTHLPIFTCLYSLAHTLVDIHLPIYASPLTTHPCCGTDHIVTAYSIVSSRDEASRCTRH